MNTCVHFETVHAHVCVCVASAGSVCQLTHYQCAFVMLGLICVQRASAAAGRADSCHLPGESFAG